MADGATPARNDEDAANARSIAVVYAGYFAALGVQGPFLALYLGTRGLSTAEIAYMLALLPISRVLATPGWTLLADRLRSAGAVLRIISIGSLLSFAVLAFGPSFAVLTAALLAFTAFRSPASSLIDVMALQWSARAGGEFGRLRSWGTVGYTAGTFCAGVLISHAGPAAIVPAAVVLLALTALATFSLPASVPPQRVRLLPALAVLARRPRFVLLLASAALHQVGLGAYDALFPAYLTRLSTATYAGAAIAFGAAAEVLFMTRARGVLKSLGLGGTLILAYGVTCVRWLIIALVPQPIVLIAVQALHAFTFGAFYLASVAIVEAESPPEVRASGQGIFATTTWGLASSAGLVLAGWIEPRAGMRGIFLAATAASIVATLLALLLQRGDKR